VVADARGFDHVGEYPLDTEVKRPRARAIARGGRIDYGGSAAGRRGRMSDTRAVAAAPIASTTAARSRYGSSS